MHTDESVHAIKFLGLWERGEYRYDPHEYHGPTLYYATLPWVWLRGVGDRGELTESDLRWVAVVFGVGLVGLLGLVVPFQGWRGVLVAAVLTAVSPSMVFYSRYFIHEMMLVFFTFGFLACLWRYACGRERHWLLGAAAFLALMQATKETYVFNVVAVVAGFAGVYGWGRFRCEDSCRLSVRRQDLLWGLGVFLVVSTVLFTSFFQNWRGPLDAWLTYGPWISRAEGQSPHVHSWSYYWEILLYTKRGGGPVWSEAAIAVLALAGVVGSMRVRGMERRTALWGRFLAFYTLVLSAIYTLIPYKTPWCVLGFWHGWILLAGLGVVWLWDLWRHVVWRVALGGCVVVACANLGQQAYRSATRYADSQRNPYVYAHTVASLLELVELVESVAAVHSGDDAPVIKVMAGGGDYWPLPWYLRSYRVGWYGGVPGEAGEALADIVIASPAFEKEIGGLLGEEMMHLGLFGLRPSVFLQLHVSGRLWEQYLGRDRVTPVP
jgi:uncharacterized protein (TIGR03663 family)